MVIRNSNFQLLQRPSMAACLGCATIHDGRSDMVSSPDEDAGIGWVFQDAKDTGIDRLNPDHLAMTRFTRECRDQKFLIAIPQQNLPHTAQLTKFAKDGRNSFLDLPVGCLFDALV